MTNREVYAKHETTKYRATDMISKDPFAAIRHADLVEPLYMIRHPLAVLTSHHGTVGKGFYWDGKGRAPYSLKRHYEVLGHPRYRYEDLCADPDGFQERIGADFGLEYDRRWSTWPWDMEIPEYWHKSLGDPEPIRPAREHDYTGDIPQDLAECIYELGYV